MTLRTIHGFVCEAKKRDSSSAINETFIRKLVKEGRLPCIRSGNRTYLDIEKTFAALNLMITESIAETSIELDKQQSSKHKPSIHSLDPYERADAKLQKIKIA